MINNIGGGEEEIGDGVRPEIVAVAEVQYCSSVVIKEAYEAHRWNFARMHGRHMVRSPAIQFA